MRTAEERYALVARVLAGESQKSVEISMGISSGVLSKWVRCYKIYGYDGLNMKKGRPPKHPEMKKIITGIILTLTMASCFMACQEYETIGDRCWCVAHPEIDGKKLKCGGNRHNCVKVVYQKQAILKEL